jgi:hypothetical protein
MSSIDHPGARETASITRAVTAHSAFPTDQIPGFRFDPALVGAENACPIDNHGNLK